MTSQQQPQRLRWTRIDNQVSTVNRRDKCYRHHTINTVSYMLYIKRAVFELGSVIYQCVNITDTISLENCIKYLTGIKSIQGVPKKGNHLN